MRIGNELSDASRRRLADSARSDIYVLRHESTRPILYSRFYTFQKQRNPIQRGIRQV